MPTRTLVMLTLVASLTSAQTAQRLWDNDVKGLMTEVIDGVAQFERGMDRQYRNATLRSPRGEVKIDIFLKDFSNACKTMRQRFKANYSASSEVQTCLVSPPDFSADLDAGRTARLQALVDGSDANTATIILGYTRSIVETYAARLGLAGEPPHAPLEIRSRVWYNEEVRSRKIIVPGLIPVIMMMIVAVLTSLTIARAWERGTLEQLASTPCHSDDVGAGRLSG